MNNKCLLYGLDVNRSMSLAGCLAVHSNDTSSKSLTSYSMKYNVVKSSFFVISNRFHPCFSTVMKMFFVAF